MGEDPFGRDKEAREGAEGGWLPPRPETPGGETFEERLRAGRAARAGDQARAEAAERERRLAQQVVRESAWDQPQAADPWGGVPQNSSRATASLVLGIIGLLLCPLICSVLALVFGYQARAEIDRSGGRVTGRGNATAGIVLGWIGVALGLLYILLFAMGVAFLNNLPGIQNLEDLEDQQIAPALLVLSRALEALPL